MSLEHTSQKAEHSERRRFGFSVIFLLSLVGCLSIAVLINLVGDGTALFPSPGFPPSTCIRAWKARRLARLARTPGTPRVLVMGSSRVFSLREADVQELTGLSAFNFGVSVGCPVDAVAQLRYALDAGVKPELIVLGVDELAFGENPEADHYDMQLVTNSGLFRELDLRDRIPILVRALKTISLKSTTASMRNLWRRVRLGETFPEGQELPEAELEGAHPSDWEALSESDRRERLQAGIREKVAFWGRYLDRPDKIEGMRPTSRKLRLFEDFVKLAAQHDIRVDVALLPVHPSFEKEAFPPQVLAIRAELAGALATRCARDGCTFRDYTDLGSFGGTSEDFEDGTHMSVRNGRRLLARLLAP